jgi:choline kinase
VTDALGEAVGINLISADDKPRLVARLEECDDQDYFERGLELAIERDGVKVSPVDISDLFAVEVDFAEDLARAIEARRAHARASSG